MCNAVEHAGDCEKPGGEVDALNPDGKPERACGGESLFLILGRQLMVKREALGCKRCQTTYAQTAKARPEVSLA